MMDEDEFIWKKTSRKGHSTPKGRQVKHEALAEIQELLGNIAPRRDLLIEYLHLIQDKFGFIHVDYIAALAEIMKLAQSEVYEVASFYAHFDIVHEEDTPPPPLTIRVCSSLSCELAGARQLKQALDDTLNADEIRIIHAPCMGRCHSAPTLEIGHNHIDNAGLEKVEDAIATQDFHTHIPDYQSLASYLNEGGYKILLALQSGEKSLEEVEKILNDSGLRGLGGAGFPTARKWSLVRSEPAPRFLAVNGDEGEPGTFKDRHYLERQPHIFLEGMLIAAFAIDAEKIFIYMRDEYPAVREILRREIAALEAAGQVVPNYIELRRGAGAYICGEESAMIESIEGKRGLPRHRPPFVAQKGIFNRPTLVNNVETLYWVTRILREGAEIMTSVEKNGRKGLRSFSVSGRVKNPGVYELPAGSTILDIIDAAGGMPEGHSFKAYQPGGASSGLLPAEMNNIPLDFDTLQPYGSFIGSAAVVILSDKDSAREAALNMLRFFEDESCGQCTPCRVGCEKAVKLMQAKQWDKALLEDLCQTMTDASICGLGQAAPNAILLTMKHFPKETGQ